MHSNTRGSIVAISRKLAVAIGVALLLSFIGTFDGIGYHARLLKLTFGGVGGADVYALVEESYNPILHPFNWLTNRESVIGEFGGTVQGNKARGGYIGPQDYFQNFAFEMSLWGAMENLVILLIVTITIEIAGERLLYILLFAGAFGFSEGIIGTIFGLAVGIAFFLIYKLELAKKGFFARFWD